MNTRKHNHVCHNNASPGWASDHHDTFASGLRQDFVGKFQTSVSPPQVGESATAVEHAPQPLAAVASIHLVNSHTAANATANTINPVAFSSSMEGL